jgi:uncharacterized membrane protein
MFLGDYAHFTYDVSVKQGHGRVMSTRVEFPDRGDEKEPLFDAVLHPHRSLTPEGFLILMIAIAVVSFGAGIAFLVAGAWPVFGFFGLDVMLIYVGFRINYRGANMYEAIRLTEDELTIRRVDPDGQVETWQFQPYWLRVDYDEAEDGRGELTLSSHGRTIVVGAFLSPDERVELADALRSELRKLREAPV